MRLRGRRNQAATEELQQRVTRLRRRLKRARDELGETKVALARSREELRTLRAESLVVFPDVTVPDDLDAGLRAIRQEHLTFLSQDQLLSLTRCVLELEQAGREGIVVEAGTARGGSAIALARAKAPGRRMQVFDVFGMIPPPSEHDGEDVHRRYGVIASGQAKGRAADEPYYGYRDDLLDEVRASFARHGAPVDETAVELVPGLFEDTITGDDPVALAHVDGDWYESTMTCLTRLAPRLVPHGRIVVDDYFHWSGCRRAVDEYFTGRKGYRVEKRAKVHVVRLPG